MVTKTLSSYPSVFRGKAIQLLLPRHSWCGCVTLLFPPFVVRASCCACDSAVGLAGWAALGAPLHPTCPSCGRSDSCLVGGAERRSYQHSRLACYTRTTGPASARPVRPGTCADWRSAPDDPVQGTSWPCCRFAASPRPRPGHRCFTASPRPRPRGCCSASPQPCPLVYITASPRPCPHLVCSASPQPRSHLRFSTAPLPCSHGCFSAPPRPHS